MPIAPVAVHGTLNSNGRPIAQAVDRCQSADTFVEAEVFGRMVRVESVSNHGNESDRRRSGSARIQILARAFPCTGTGRPRAPAGYLDQCRFGREQRGVKTDALREIRHTYVNVKAFHETSDRSRM